MNTIWKSKHNIMELDDAYPVVHVGPNPDEEIPTTHEQRTSLFRKWKQAKNGDFPDDTPNWQDFCKTVQPTFGMDGAITVQWCGMYLAIERDGYTHS